MITTVNFKDVLTTLGFREEGSPSIFRKAFGDMFAAVLTADFNKQELTYPEKLVCHDKTTCNFAHPENFVVFECVARLLEKGYRPEHIELEKRWNLGHDAKGGKADICVYNQDHKTMLMIIECKTFGSEYGKALKEVNQDGGQLFSYWQQERSTQWLALYASDFQNGQIIYINDIINCSDDQNLLELAKKDDTIKLYKDAYSVPELFEVWTETYAKAFYQELIFGEDTVAYQIGVRPLRKKDLRDFAPGDKIVNRFEEILRHNNVSDKENAFNRLTALFICKLVDEIRKVDSDELEFQYKQGIDTYETLQDRLQRLHREGMKDFMKEEIFYVGNDYAEKLVKQYSGQKRKAMIEELQKTIRILKFYTNNDFSFKDVHNEELFYQNGKVLVEVVQLFEHYRIVYPNKHQFLGDLFEQLLNKGFKQNEGQFFTPMPITRFVWDSLPLDRIIHNSDKYAYPKVIDFACGAGHFLTEAVEAINDYLKRHGFTEDNAWVEKKIFGIEKDYRLARVSKISLFMNGAGYGNVIFGDGLDNYPEKQIEVGSFDILVANPPYSVSAFKAHFKPKNNHFELIDRITNDGSEIEVLFVERIAQLLKPKGIAAVILPASILSNSSNSYIGARENLLENFNIRAIAQFGSKTFGATGTNTIILFLEKYDEPPKRKDMVKDSVSAILSQAELTDWEDKNILQEYLAKIQVSEEDYSRMFSRKESLGNWKEHAYFGQYVNAFLNRSEVKTKLKQASFKKLSKTEQNAWLQEHFYQYIEFCEQEKLHYFALVYQQKTLVITAPTGNDEQKEFLGYDWSNRKGAEGIQILTPGGKLYNDTDRTAEKTISSLIRASFDGQKHCPPELEKYLAYHRLQDMIDFSRVEFYKEIKTAISEKLLVQSQWPLVELKNILTTIESGSRPKGGANGISGGVLSLGGEHIDNQSGFISLAAPKYVPISFFTNATKGQIRTGDILLCKDGALTGKIAKVGQELDGQSAMVNEHVFILRSSDIITQNYVFAYLYSEQGQRLLRSEITGSAQGGLSQTNLSQISIPFPPLNIQQQVVSECEAVDTEYRKAKDLLARLSLKQEKVFQKISGEMSLLGNLVEFKNGLNYTRSSSGDIVEIVGVKDFQEYFSPMMSELEKIQIDGKISSDYLLKPGDILVVRSNGSQNLVGRFMYIKEVNHNTSFSGFTIRLRVKTNNIDSKWLCYYLRTNIIRSKMMTDSKGSNIKSINQGILADLVVPVPSYESQQKQLAEIEEYEQQLKAIQQIIAAAPAKKQAVLDKYL